MSSVENCCANCFGDRGLQNNIIPSLSERTGICPYCLTENVILIEPEKLANVFGPLVNIYEPDGGGRLLVEWLRSDWELFTHPRMIDERANGLLTRILSNEEIVRKRLVPAKKYQSDRLGRWEQLRTELMHENRYFPATQLDLERLKELLDHLQADDIPAAWHRARIQTADGPIRLEHMGAPPLHTASHGRANPAGIPYLYLASTPKTAVAEIRPHTGDKATVAEFAMSAASKLVDLRSPRRLVSPFVIADEDEIGLLRSDIDFLERLGDELTRPIVPQSAPFDYVPSQYLCEFIKKCGYSGVLYRSSVGDGMNFALFNPAFGAPRSIAQYDVVRVTVDIELTSVED